MCTEPSVATLSDGPAWGQPGNTQPSSRGRTGSLQVFPPSVERATTMSRTSPGKIFRHAAYRVPSGPTPSAVRQQGQVGSRWTPSLGPQVRPPSSERRIQTPEVPFTEESQDA